MNPLEAALRLASPADGDQIGRIDSDGSVHVDATTPWLLDSPRAAWRVLEGRVDVFAIPVGDRLVRREFLRSFLPGEVLGGCPAPDGDIKVVAIAVPGTRLSAASVDDALMVTGPDGEPLLGWLARSVAERQEVDSARIHALQEEDLQALDRADVLVSGVTRRRTRFSSSDSDVAVAVTALAAFEGLPKPESIPGELFGDTFDKVCTIVGTIGATARRVRREAGWWSEPDDGFIAENASGVAVAVLPNKARWGGRSRRHPYVAVIGADTIEVDDELGASLSLDGIALQRIWGPAPLRRRDLLRVVRRSARVELIWSGILAVAVSLMGLLVPITLGKVVSSAVPNRQEEQIVGLIVMLLAAAFGAFVFDVVRSLTLLRLEGEYDRNLLPAVWDRILRLPVGFFRGFDVGDLTSRIMGLDEARQLTAQAVVQGVQATVFAIVNLTLMFVVAPKLAVPATAVILAFAVLAAILTKSASTHTRRQLRLAGRKDAMTLQLVKGVSTIRVAGATSIMFARWVELLATVSRARQRAALSRGMVTVAAGALGLAASAAAYAAAAAAGEVISISTFAVFATALGVATASVATLPTVAGTLTTTLALVDRTEPILSARPELSSGGARPELSGRIAFEDLTFAYSDDELQVLDSFSLRIPTGSFTALVGPSGCGKSTVLRCLLGFERPHRGVVLLDDHSLGELDLGHVRRQFGVVPQRLTLLGGTILSNIIGPRSLTEDDAWAAAEKVGLADFIRTLPMGMRTVMIDGGSTLSGGQVQRVMLARALAGAPNILLLDEATSALDNPTQQIVTESLAREACTRLIVAHRLSTVRQADQIAVMDQGRIVELGQHEELLARDGTYARLVRRQL